MSIAWIGLLLNTVATLALSLMMQAAEKGWVMEKGIPLDLSPVDQLILEKV